MNKKETKEEMIEAFRALIAKDEALYGKVTEEDLRFEAEQQRELDEFHARYPGNNGSESAWFLADGSIHVHYGVRTGGFNSHGDIVYKTDDPEFERIWNRHKMGEADGRSHFIMKKWDEELQNWNDLGDGWGPTMVLPPQD